MSQFHSAVARSALAACLVAAAGGAVAQTAPSPSQTGKAAALIAQGSPAKAEGDPACPRVVILRGSESFPKAKSDGFRATVEGLARDCANLGAETILRVGVVGEGTRAGAKGPSWFNVPLSVAVMDDRGNAVASSKAKIKVQLPRGKTEGPFAHVVENVSLPPAANYAGWSVVVGFEMNVADVQRAAKVMTAGR